MAVFLIAYFILLILVAVYVAVNFYHVIRFRLDVPGDKSFLILTIYLASVAIILVGSIIMGVISYRL